jgi:hypothetical protein
MLVELVPAVVNLPPEQHPRTQGVHVGRVIGCIATESGILDAKWIEDLSLVEISGESWWSNLSPDNQLRIGIGLAWEQWYAPTLSGVVFHPGEMEVDGIYMTPDGVDVIRSGPTPTDAGSFIIALHEFKTTYKSVKTVADLQTQWMWLTQMKAYCKGLGTTIAYMHTLFLCGDYKYPIRPQLRMWKITFSEAEIEESWDIITGYVRHRQLVEREEAGLEGGV